MTYYSIFGAGGIGRPCKTSTRLKKVIVHRKSGSIVKPAAIRWRRSRVLFLALTITGILSSLSDFHLDEILGIPYSIGFDILQHGGYYLLLTMTLLYFLPLERRSGSFFLFLFSFSVIFEFLQLLIPGRSFSGIDIFSNLLGISTGMMLMNLYYNSLGKK